MERKRKMQTRQGKIEKIIKSIRAGIDITSGETIEKKVDYYLWAIDRVEPLISVAMVEVKTKLPADTQREIHNKVSYAAIMVMRKAEGEEKATMYKEILEALLEVLEKIKPFV